MKIFFAAKTNTNVPSYLTLYYLKQSKKSKVLFIKKIFVSTCLSLFIKAETKQSFTLKLKKKQFPLIMMSGGIMIFPLTAT